MIADQFAYKICEIDLDKFSRFAIAMDSDYTDMPALVETYMYTYIYILKGSTGCPACNLGLLRVFLVLGRFLTLVSKLGFGLICMYVCVAYIGLHILHTIHSIYAIQCVKILCCIQIQVIIIKMNCN